MYCKKILSLKLNLNALIPQGSNNMFNALKFFAFAVRICCVSCEKKEVMLMNEHLFML